MKILNFGSLNMDYVYQVEHFVRPGETMNALSQCVNCGGKGLNQSVALAKAGAKVYHAGCIGTGGERLAREYQVPYLPSDFKKRDGYKRSLELSREYGLYRQNYCGCIYSIRT